jgi:hypothetical protein
VTVPRFNLLGNPVHGARELGGNGPFGSGQIAVARREGSPSSARTVGTPDLDGHGHVGHHLANERQLLVILLAEAGHVRLYQIEQLGDHGADPAKCPGRSAPSSRLEMPGTSTKVWLASPWGYMISGVGVKTRSTPAASRRRNPAPGCGVVGEILGLVELQGVHEDADHHLVAMAAGLLDQGEMTLMQIAHGGHECDGAAFAMPLTDLLAQRGGIVHNNIVSSPSDESIKRGRQEGETGAQAPARDDRKSVEAVLGAGEGPLAHLLHVETNGGTHVTGLGQEVLGELGHITRGDAEGIVHHQDLAIGGRAGTDADHRNAQRLGDALCQRDGTHSSTSNWMPAACSSSAWR